MDYGYINTICEAYFNDTQLYKHDIFKSIDDGVVTLQNEMKNIIQNLRLEDLDLYYDLQSHDKLDQQKIMYALLDSYMISQFPELIEEGWIWDIASVLGRSADWVLKQTTTPTGLVSVIIGMLATVYFFKGITKIKHSVVRLLYDMVVGLTKIIEKVSVSGKVKNAILNTHLEKCAGKCGLGTTNPWKEMSRLTTFAIKSKLPFTEKSKEQAECLIDCYLSYIINQIKTVAESYVNCLKSTGELPSDLSSFSLLERKPMGEQCHIFYETLKKVEDEFREAIDYIFSDTPRERQDWINKFNSAILESMKINQRQSFKPPQRDFKQRTFSKGPRRY